MYCSTECVSTLERSDLTGGQLLHDVRIGVFWLHLPALQHSSNVLDLKTSISKYWHRSLYLQHASSVFAWMQYFDHSFLFIFTFIPVFFYLLSCFLPFLFFLPLFWLSYNRCYPSTSTELIDDITQRTDNTRNRLVDETDNITTTTRKTRTWRKSSWGEELMGYSGELEGGRNTKRKVERKFKVRNWDFMIWCHIRHNYLVKRRYEELARESWKGKNQGRKGEGVWCKDMTQLLISHIWHKYLVKGRCDVLLRS